MSGPAYVISVRRRTLWGYVIVEGVTDALQRFTVGVPWARSTEAEIAATIEHTLAALAAPPRPIR